jgi:hypothetical protein
MDGEFETAAPDAPDIQRPRAASARLDPENLHEVERAYQQTGAEVV